MTVVRAVIDKTGLPEAASYYRMFQHEPGRTSDDDMTVTVDSADELRHITMEAVLDRMQAAAQAGERELLIVAHGEPEGFIMPIAAGGSSAVKDALEIVSRAGAALARRVTIRARPASEQVAAWGELIEELAPGTVRGAIAVPDAERWFEHTWLAAQAHALRLHGGHETQVLERLVDKMNRVRHAQFQRVEVRACNIGANVEALRALCQFWGARRVCAPNVGTFYVSVHPFVRESPQESERQRTLAHWERTFGGPVLGGLYRHQVGPAARHFDVFVGPSNVPVGFLIPEGFRIRVWETSRHPHRYASQAAAARWWFVKAWVNQNITPNAHYERGTFLLAGMWTFGRGPDPFAAPLDPAYRGVLVCQEQA